MNRHVFDTMGTVVSVAAEEVLERQTIASVEEVFDAFDQRFSLYKPDSELSRIADGRLSLLASSEQLREAYADSLHWRSRTHGAFTPHRPDGVIDLSGIVKALAIDAAGAVLDAHGLASWILDCGGDVLTRRTDAAAGHVIGVTDPDARDRLLTALRVDGMRRAVATSGVSERGEHIWGPRVDFDQVTVLADDIVTADVLATAILAGGRELCDELTTTVDCDVLAVRLNREIIATPRMREAIERATAAPAELASPREQENRR